MKAKIGILVAALLAATPAFAAGYSVTPLVSDQAGVAPVQDTDLINPWGLAQQSDGAPVWTSDNGTSKSTFYDRTTGVKQSPIVAVPSLPTGIVYVPGSFGFKVTEGANTGACSFIFDTISGVVSCWAPSVDTTNALTGYDGSAQHSVYTGLAIDGQNEHLLMADLANNQVQILDNTWTVIGSFTDPELPKKYAPFNVQILKGKVYVAFTRVRKNRFKHKKGEGYVDVFDLSGNLQTRLIANGNLDHPWGLAIAPASFGQFANDLLVGNFGDGKINVYDPTTGSFLGTMKGANGKPLVIDGLWALDSGPGTSKVQFSSGPDKETHGLIGTLTPN
jgi:uncharacterized protein (TIGR03118 family)